MPGCTAAVRAAGLCLLACLPATGPRRATPLKAQMPAAPVQEVKQHWCRASVHAQAPPHHRVAPELPPPACTDLHGERDTLGVGLDRPHAEEDVQVLLRRAVCEPAPRARMAMHATQLLGGSHRRPYAGAALGMHERHPHHQTLPPGCMILATGACHSVEASRFPSFLPSRLTRGTRRIVQVCSVCASARASHRSARMRMPPAAAARQRTRSPVLSTLPSTRLSASSCSSWKAENSPLGLLHRHTR